MAKKKSAPLPQMPGMDPITMKSQMGPIAGPEQVTPNPQGPSAGEEIWKWNPPSWLGGKSQASMATGEGPRRTYDPDEMLRTYLPGLDDQQRGFLRAELRAHEKGSGKDYHSAINELMGAHPELSQYSNWSKHFPAPAQPGELSPEAMGRLLQLTSQYQRPYLDQLNAIGSHVSGALKKLAPGLPESYRGLIQSEIPVYENLGAQLGAALGLSNPGQILNAYARAYAPQQQQAAAGNNLFSSLLQGGP